MNRHTPNLGSRIMQRYPPDLRKTGVGGVMVQIVGAAPADPRIRVTEPPEDGIDRRLACSLQGLRGFHGHVPVMVSQSQSQRLQSWGAHRSPAV